MQRLKLLALLVIGLSHLPVRAQDWHKAHAEAVSFDSVTHRLYFEQRVYRNPMSVIRRLNELSPLSNDAEIAPLFQGVPITAYRINRTLTTRTLSIKERRTFTRSTPFDARKYLFDFRLLPEFSAIFGYREKVVETKTNILLQNQLMLSRGLVLNWGILFPLINNWDNQPLNIRPAPFFLNQFLALGKADFMSISAGFFYNDQYGFNAQYRHNDLKSPWSFGVETGLTGFYFYPPSNIYYEPISQLLFLADAAYRIKRYDITLKCTAGQFLYKDRGVRLDFIRQFNNVDIGFFVTNTGNGSTGGFNFAIPLLPGPIARNRKMRLRAAEEFRWEYTYSRGYRIAERYRVGYQLDALLRQYHQDYLTNQLIR